MAAFLVGATLEAIVDHFRAHGGYEVLIGEPKSPPIGEKVTIAFFMTSTQITRIFADGGTGEVHVVTGRIYGQFIDNEEVQEKTLAEALSTVTASLLADATAGGTVMLVDAAGSEGVRLTATWGHVELGGTMYRAVDIVIPFIVNDSATLGT